MDGIRKERPRKEDLERMGVANWPVWEKEVADFEWHHDERETCYNLEGRARVEPGAAPRPSTSGPGSS